MGAVVEEIKETEEQAAARIRRMRTRKALAAAPELAHQLRWDSVPLDGHTERGWLPAQRTPLITAAVDASDYLYAHLHGWTAYFADQLQIVGPTAYGWRNLHDPDAPLIGLSADASPETAHALVTSAAAWLLWHENAIADHEDAAEYQGAVAFVVWGLRAQAGLIQPRRNTHVKRTDITEYSTRPCPNCTALEVQVEYFGEPMESAESRGERLDPTPYENETDEQALNQFAQAIAGVTVRCTHCGWSPQLTPSKIARWLTPEAINPRGPVPVEEQPSLKREGDKNWHGSESA